MYCEVWRVLEANPIELTMKKIIVENIKQHNLKELLMNFVQAKSRKNYPFGELCLFHYEHFTPSFDKEIYTVAAAVECLLLAFDILDDLEDDDMDDKPWSKDTGLSLNGSTALLFLSMQAIRRTHFTHKEKAIALMERLALQSIEGQHKDLLNVCKEENAYIDMMEEKSGSLVSLSCLIGCVIANGEVPQEVENYSKWLGMIGQINNDISDLKKWNRKNDIINKKYSLPIIYLLELEKQGSKLVTNYYENKMSKEELLQVKSIIQQRLIDTDAIQYALVIKKLFHFKVKEELMKLNFTKAQLNFLQEYMK